MLNISYIPHADPHQSVNLAGRDGTVEIAEDLRQRLKLRMQEAGDKVAAISQRFFPHLPAGKQWPGHGIRAIGRNAGPRSSKISKPQEHQPSESIVLWRTLAAQDLQEDIAEDFGLTIGLVFLECFEPALCLSGLGVPPSLIVK
jgi:hypothetical protein